MSNTPEDLKIFRDNFKYIGKEIQALKDTLGSESGEGLERERRRLTDEIRSSQNINAQAAEHLVGIEEDIKKPLAKFEAEVKPTSVELRKKERSAQTWTQLLQTRQADVEQQLANVIQELQELTSFVGQNTATASATNST